MLIINHFTKRPSIHFFYFAKPLKFKGGHAGDSELMVTLNTFLPIFHDFLPYFTIFYYRKINRIFLPFSTIFLNPLNSRRAKKISIFLSYKNTFRNHYVINQIREVPQIREPNLYLIKNFNIGKISTKNKTKSELMVTLSTYPFF